MIELNDFDLELLWGRNFAHVVTLRPDCSPQATVVWIDADPERNQVLVNSAVGRVKDRNLRRDPRVSVSVHDQEDPLRFVSILGVVEEFVTGEEAERHIDSLNRRYHDGEAWTHDPGQVRVIYRIRPERILRYTELRTT